MSFTIQKTVTPLKVYTSLLGAAARGDEEVVAVTYSIVSIISLIGTTCVVEYSVDLDNGAMSGRGEFSFAYSGAGNPLEEAEEELKMSLSEA